MFKNIFGVVMDYFSTMLPCTYKQHTSSPSNEFMLIYMHLKEFKKNIKNDILDFI